jgi:PAS domain S-box-containing protein
MTAAQSSDIEALYLLTDRLYRARSLNDVFDAALDAITGTLGCERASMLLFDETGVMRFVAWRGLSDHYRDELEGHTPWRPGERDPEPIFVEDIEQTNESDRVKRVILEEDIRALSFIPLVADGVVVGKFMAYYPHARAFAEQERDLAVTIARQVGFSLERARAEKARHAAEEGLRESEERFRLMSESAPVMIWMSDEHGRCLHLNKMLREFWGVREENLKTFDWRVTMHPQDVDDIGRKMFEALRERKSVTIRGRYLRSDGVYRVLETSARPRMSPRGEMLGMIGVNVDLTERAAAEAALRESEQRFRGAVEAAPSGMIMVDAPGRITMANRLAEKLFGYESGEMIGLPIENLVPERYRAAHPGHRQGYMRSPTARLMGAERDLFGLRKDGSAIPVELGLSPIQTADGPMTLAAIVDITARKAAESQRELLLAELSHRAKNTLAVVQAIANQTFQTGRDQASAQKAFEGRLIALGIAHDLLINANWEHASFEELAASTLHSQQYTSRVELSGPHVLLSPRQALSLSMAIHELFTNAWKHGALSIASGRVDLRWSFTDGDRLHIEWREQGGPAVSPPTRRGFGSVLLERILANDLGADVETQFGVDGLVCTIIVPLDGPTAKRRGNEAAPL